MTDCNDRRFEKLLHAYELGMLTEEERREFEQHLLDCTACFEKVNQFASTTELLEEDNEVQKSIDRIVSSEVIPEAKSVRRKFWNTAIPTSIAAAAVLVFLILTDWQLEFKPSQEAVATENRLAIMPFENLADPEDSARLSVIVPNLLIADLSESSFLQVVSSQHLYDITKLLNLEVDESISPVTALRIAEQASARWFLTGSILQVKPHIIISYQLGDVSSGEVLASDRILGKEDEDVFTLVDRTSSEIRRKLTLPLAARNEPDRMVADVTTHSSEAYRHYLEGVDYYLKHYNVEAIECFHRALEHDSTHAMSYYYLTSLEDISLIDKAVLYAENTGIIDRHFIISLQACIAGETDRAIDELENILRLYPDDKNALYKLGNLHHNLDDYSKAANYLEKAVEVDPLFKTAYNYLAYTYQAKDDFQGAIWAIDKYIEIVPNEANPYDTRGDIYGNNGMIDEAIDSYRKALEKKPDFTASLYKLGHMYLYRGDYELADSCYCLADDLNPAWVGVANYYRASVRVYEGRLNESIIAFDNIDVVYSNSGLTTPEYILRTKALVYREMGDLDEAINTQERVVKNHRERHPTDKVNEQYFLVQFLAENGEFERAEEIAEGLKEGVSSTSAGEQWAYWYALGVIELAKDNSMAAITALEEASEIGRGFPVQFMLARAYLAADQPGKAVDVLEKEINTYNASWRICLGPWSTKMHYWLAVAYEQVGENDEAVAQLKTFLDKWRNADSNLVALKDAKERLDRLSINP